jgi:hypothetical protein
MGDGAAEGDGGAALQMAEVVADRIAEDPAAAQLTGRLGEIEVPIRRRRPFTEKPSGGANTRAGARYPSEHSQAALGPSTSAE